MLSLGNRLTDESDFKRVKYKGRVVQSTSYALATYFRGDTEPSRFGFVVSKNVSKNASKRNMIKRALSEALRHNLTYIKDGYDIVFLAKPAAGGKYVADLMGEVREVLVRAKLLK